MLNNKTVLSVDFGGRPITIETGRMAKQADGSVVVTYGETVVLVTAVSNKKPKPGQSFFPLTVDYMERYYANGKFPGGFFKRENRPSNDATLIARLIDRPIRPLFPEGYLNDTQVVATVLSVDQDNDPEIAASLGASASSEGSRPASAAISCSVAARRLAMSEICARASESWVCARLTSRPDAAPPSCRARVRSSARLKASTDLRSSAASASRPRRRK